MAVVTGATVRLSVLGHYDADTIRKLKDRGCESFDNGVAHLAYKQASS